MKPFFSVILVMTLIISSLSCKKKKDINQDEPVVKTDRMVVISDLHFFDAEQLLVPPSADFDAMAATNDVMLLHSMEILDKQFQKIQELNPSIVMIAGDLVANGEQINHQLLHERFLAPLISNGVSVFVIPGNHDINNPNAAKYNGDQLEPIPSVTANEFAEIYADCGFSKAVSRDANTLSYSAVLNDRLALIALDVCHYGIGIDEYEWLSGSVSAETMQWMEGQIASLKNGGREVVVMMHHSATEIFANENLFIPGFVLEDNVAFCDKLVELGVKFVFNGHFHSHDITQYNQEPLFDFSVGSLTSCACPIRLLDFENDIMKASTTTLLHWDQSFDGQTFDQYSDQCVTGYITNYIQSYTEPFGITDPVIIDMMIQAGTEAFITHYHGDEVLSAETQEQLNGYMEQVPILTPILNGLLINGLYKDIVPQDNTIQFNFVTGAIVE
ncbi:MAG: metallophosphoesterase [Bacteroidales bacterium]|nr:metallophosphoesterase [Bacteroidales bacterium]